MNDDRRAGNTLQTPCVDECNPKCPCRSPSPIGGSRNCVLLENVGTAILVIEPDTTIGMLNAKAVNIFGYRLEDLLHKSFLDFLTPEYQALAGHYHELILSRQIDPPEALECRLYDKSGRIRDVSAKIGWLPQSDQAVIALIDRTDIVSTESERHNLNQIVEQSAESVLLTDLQGRILYANAAFEDLSGYDRGEIVGRTVQHPFFSDQDRLIFKKMGFSVSCGAVGHHRTENLHKSGRPMSTETRIAAVCDVKGQAVHLVCTKTDITREIELEQQLAQSQKMEAIGTLASGIAHDFNNILSGISGYAQMGMQSAGDRERIRKYMGRILQACDRASDLASQVVSFSRRKAAEARPRRIQPLVTEALDLLRASLPATIELRQSLRAEDGLVLADATHLHQIVINLCTNAAQAMEAGGGLLEVTLSPLDLPCADFQDTPAAPDGPYLCLSVRDTGEGIDTKSLERIFEPYYTTKGGRGGSGLGLSVVQKLVKNMGGFMRVTSRAGDGSTFEVYLPRTAGQTPSEMAQEPILPGGHERILVVDDEIFILEVLRDMLSGLGYHVESAQGAHFALERIGKTPDRYDLVIADVNMPHINGRQLAGKIQDLAPDVPIVLCTGLALTLGHFQNNHPNIVALLTKPIQYDQLAVIVREILDKIQR